MTTPHFNYPARIATYMSAGLPLIQRENQGAIVASKSLALGLRLGLFSNQTGELVDQLHDRTKLTELSDNA